MFLSLWIVIAFWNALCIYLFVGLCDFHFQRRKFTRSCVNINEKCWLWRKPRGVRRSTERKGKFAPLWFSRVRVARLCECYYKCIHKRILRFVLLVWEWALFTHQKTEIRKKSILKIWDTILRSSLNLCCCNMGGSSCIDRVTVIRHESKSDIGNCFYTLLC